MLLSEPRGAEKTGSVGLRFVTGLRPEVAFSKAVSHLMVREVFARAPFGHIARALAGQVNRGHYGFAMRGDAVEGFAGWARTDEAAAQAWLEDTRVLGQAEAAEGPCLVLNFWQAETPDVSRFLLDHLRETMPDIRLVCAKRHYPDGRIRRLRLVVPDRAPRPETGVADLSGRD